MCRTGRRSVALLIAFECLLLLVAWAGYGTQGNAGQDQPIEFRAVLLVILGVGNAVGLSIALLPDAAWLRRERNRR